MRIIHFSDVHAGGWLRDWTGLFDKRLLGTANHLLRRARHHRWARLDAAVRQIRLLNPDVVLCTGDITSLSEPAEFRQAAAALEPLVCDRRFEFIYVPGNHDCYVPSRRLRQALADHFYQLNRHRWTLSALPAALDCKGLRLLALNEATPGPLIGSFGRLSSDSAAWLRRELGDAQQAPPAGPPLALVHHYPLRDASGRPLGWRRSCHGAEDLGQAWDAGRLRFSFCGHIHSPFIRCDGGDRVEICAGSLTHFGVFSLVDYEPATGTMQHRWVTVDDDGPSAIVPMANALPSEG